MSICKSRISSPLEAGTSLLDVDYLPEHVTDALEYASKRLARRNLHICLVVVRRDYQLPAAFPSPLSPALGLSSVPSTPCSPAPAKTPLSPRFAFASSPMTTLKRLVRTTGSAVASPLPSPACSVDSERSWRTGPLSSNPTWPTTPGTPLSMPPTTPLLTASSSSTTDFQEACTPHPFGIRLVYADLLTDKQKDLLRQTMDRTEKKFRIGPGWLPQPVDASSCGLSRTIAHRSLLQNEVLFASAGLTLVPLDRLYTFKSALSSYARTAAPLRLEDAVDELRRLVLARKGRGVARADVARSYDWLSFSEAALRDVDRMYRRAYGGRAGEGAIEGVGVCVPVPAAAPKDAATAAGDAASGESEVETDFETDSTRAEEDDDDGTEAPDREKTPVAREVEVRAATRTVHIARAPAPRVPALKLQTQFHKKPSPSAGCASPAPAGMLPFGFAPLEGHKRSPAEEEDPATARPVRHSPFWGRVSSVTDEGGKGGDTGPMTPNGYDDISPITRGEWGFLMGDGGVRQGMKTAAVMTF